jgi:hypothetical protein
MAISETLTVFALHRRMGWNNDTDYDPK